MKTHALALLLISGNAFADPETTKPKEENQKIITGLSLHAGAGYLAAAGGGNGTALTGGVRLGLGKHLAAGFDLGYGLMGTPEGPQDRWWFMPTLAGVMPATIGGRKFTFDLGAGLGFGTASGYTSFADYASHPFTAEWEYQLVPTVRAHFVAAMNLTPKTEIFFRADAAALVLPHGTGASVTDSTWMLFSLGTRFDVL